MIRKVLMLPLLLILAACGDPLRGIDRVSENGVVLPDETSANALPNQSEFAREGGVLAGLFRRASEESPENSATREDVSDATQEQDIEIAVDVSDVAENTAPGSEIDSEIEVTSVSADTSTPERSGGVLSWLRRAAQSSAQSEVALETASFDPGEAEREINSDTQPHSTTLRESIFGRAQPTVLSGLGENDVAHDALVPFGEIARNCNAQPAQLAKVVDRSARRGVGYVLYDTAPDSTATRTFFVTGFADKCPRQFTAALALFGEPAFHEQLRYGLPSREYPYSTTDDAYEKLKRKVCNVGREIPCGTRIDKLEKTTTFISVYENFTDNARWADMLLHDGQVLAASVKEP